MLSTLGQTGGLQGPGACALLCGGYWCLGSALAHTFLSVQLGRSSFDILHSNEFIQERQRLLSKKHRSPHPLVSEKRLPIISMIGMHTGQ